MRLHHQGEIIKGNVDLSAIAYTENSKSYMNTPFTRELVRHSVGKYARENAHVNGMESLWVVLKKVCHGAYRWFSEKHMDAYAQQYASKHNLRELDAMKIMERVVKEMLGRKLVCKKLMGMAS